MLSMCEIGHEIHISLKFSFKFGQIIAIFSPVSFINLHHKVCHPYISNDLKFYETPCIYTASTQVRKDTGYQYDTKSR